MYFKKGSSTTEKGGSTKISIAKSIYSWSLLNKILDNHYLINIDESSF